MPVSYYWLRFQTAAAQTGLCFFLYRHHLMWLNNRYWAARVCWSGIKKGKKFDKCFHVAVFVIFSTSFLNSNSLSQSASSRCHSIWEAMQYHAVLAYRSFFSIKSDVLNGIQPRSIFYEQRIVSRCVFLDIVHIHGRVLTSNLSSLRKMPRYFTI